MNGVCIRRNDTSACVHTNKTDFVVMGYSVRTTSWRCTLWLWWDSARLVGDFSRDRVATELYLHSNGTENNFNTYENENVAAEHADEMAECLSMAKTHWEKPKAV